MPEQETAFVFDEERNVTLALASFLEGSGWDVIACHPPGGHSSFSILSGRRSKGGYQPDIIAIRYDETIGDHIVAIGECKAHADKTDSDIQKLIGLTETHADWISFRLQKHLNRESWIRNWRDKLQKIVAYGRGQLEELPGDTIVIKFPEKGEPKIDVGSRSPAKSYF